MKKNRFTGYVYDISADYNVVTLDDIWKICVPDTVKDLNVRVFI